MNVRINYINKIPLASSNLPDGMSHVERSNYLTCIELVNTSHLFDRFRDKLSTSVSPVLSNFKQNYYSFTFSINHSEKNDADGWYVKIPKSDMRGRNCSILPISQLDRELANQEIDSLQFLDNYWESDDLGVYWVKLIGSVPQYNAIVTRKINAREAHHKLVTIDLKRRIFIPDQERKLSNFLTRIALSLKRFHEQYSETTNYSSRKLIKKIFLYKTRIEQHTSSRWPQKIYDLLLNMDSIDLRSINVPTLKGLDIRNILIDKDENIFLLDPGKIKMTCREADIARFIMTYRILYWGRRSLLLFNRPFVEAEHTFIQSYYHGKQYNNTLLQLYILKEQFKHWFVALDTLNRSDWKIWYKKLVNKLYVEPFYNRQLHSTYIVLKSLI